MKLNLIFRAWRTTIAAVALHASQFLVRRSAELHRRAKPMALSMPHYLAELRSIRSVSALSRWVRFKVPRIFGIAPSPIYVTVEFTTLCNLRCCHCWRPSSIARRGLGSMPVPLFEKILREIRESVRRPDVFKIGGSGEPALHPQFSEMMSCLELIRGAGVHTIIYTNGTLIAKFAPQQILSWNIDRLVVSVDGTDADSYQRIRVGGDYGRLERVVRDFRTIVDHAPRRRLWIEIRHVIMEDESMAELFRFMRHWGHLGHTVKFQCPNNTNGDNGAVRRGVYRELPIQWNGNAVFSGGASVRMGNLATVTLADVWRQHQTDT